MKKIGFLIIVMVLFVIDVYAIDAPTITGSLTSTYGVNFDFDEVRSGLNEEFDFDIVWPLIPYEYSEKGDNGKFRIETDFTGSLDFTMLDNDSTWDNTITPTYTLDISNFYSKIYYDNLYFLVGSKRTGYERQDGYTIDRSAEKVGANWAYLTSRIAWSYILNSDFQVDSGSDIVNGVDGTQGTEEAIGFGGDTDSLSWILMFGTKNDWTVDEDNRFDIGYNVSYTGVDALTVNQGTYTKISQTEESAIELGAGLGVEYSYPISNSLVLKPNLGADIFVTDLEEKLLQGTEISYGVTLEWPGVSGYGSLPLQETENNRGEFKNHRSSGITIAGINYIDGNSSDDDQFNIKISAIDPREGGLVNNLELAALVEIVDVLKISDDEHNLAFGLYADYTILDSYRPKVNAVMRTIDDDRKLPVELSVGVVYVGIPSAEIGIVYENDNLSTIEDKPGRVLFSVKSFF